MALRFILDHAQDLTNKKGLAQDVAMELIAIGLRRELTCPAPATLDRRIASRFRDPNGGWEFPAFWIVGVVALALIGDGPYALRPTTRSRLPD